MSEPNERLAIVETLVRTQGVQITNIERDVRSLLESKWSRNGRPAAIAAAVAAAFTAVVAYLKP